MSSLQGYFDVGNRHIDAHDRLLLIVLSGFRWQHLVRGLVNQFHVPAAHQALYVDHDQHALADRARPRMYFVSTLARKIRCAAESVASQQHDHVRHAIYDDTDHAFGHIKNDHHGKGGVLNTAQT